MIDKNKEIVRRLKIYLLELKSSRKTIGKFNIEADLVIRELKEIITPSKRDIFGERITKTRKCNG